MVLTSKQNTEKQDGQAVVKLREYVTYLFNLCFLKSGGTITGKTRLARNAISWDDLRTPAGGLRLPATNPPQEVAYQGSIVLAFEDEAVNEDIIYFMVQLPHNWKEGTNIHPHVHWTPEDNAGGNVRWTFTYSWANVDGTFPAQTSDTITAAAGTTADKHLKSEFTTIVGTGKTISSMLICSLKRNSSDAGDTYTGKDARLLEFDFHYEIDSFGSFSELVKET